MTSYRATSSVLSYHFSLKIINVMSILSLQDKKAVESEKKSDSAFLKGADIVKAFDVRAFLIAIFLFTSSNSNQWRVFGVEKFTVKTSLIIHSQ